MSIKDLTHRLNKLELNSNNNPSLNRLRNSSSSQFGISSHSGVSLSSHNREILRSRSREKNSSSSSYINNYTNSNYPNSISKSISGSNSKILKNSSSNNNLYYNSHTGTNVGSNVGSNSTSNYTRKTSKSPKSSKLNKKKSSKKKKIVEINTGRDVKTYNNSSTEMKKNLNEEISSLSRNNSNKNGLKLSGSSTGIASIGSHAISPRAILSPSNRADNIDACINMRSPSNNNINNNSKSNFGYYDGFISAYRNVNKEPVLGYEIGMLIIIIILIVY